MDGARVARGIYLSGGDLNCDFPRLLFFDNGIIIDGHVSRFVEINNRTRLDWIEIILER